MELMISILIIVFLVALIYDIRKQKIDRKKRAGEWPEKH